MEEQMQLHEIAGYLPYRLRLTDCEQPMNGRMCELICNHYYHTRKPILRPMSDLIPVEHDEVNDMVLIKLVNETPQHCDAYDEWRDSYFDNPEPIRILQAPYEVIQELYRQHFDIHNLIDRGLAIDINTLKEHYYEQKHN